MSVLMSESFINSFKRLIHSETSQLAVLMNGLLNQLTHSIHSKTWIHSVIETPLCVAQRHTALIATIFYLRNILSKSHLILTSCLLKYYCIKSVSHCSRVDNDIQGNIMVV